MGEGRYAVELLHACPVHGGCDPAQQWRSGEWRFMTARHAATTLLFHARRHRGTVSWNVTLVEIG